MTSDQQVHSIRTQQADLGIVSEEVIRELEQVGQGLAGHLRAGEDAYEKRINARSNDFQSALLVHKLNNERTAVG